MNPNPFAILDLPESAALDDAEVQERFVQLSAACHPDRMEANPDDRQRFTEINEAHRQLRTPGGRLKALLQLRFPDAFAVKRAVPDALLTLFSDIGATLQDADAYVKKKSQATTEISQALLAPQLLEVQRGLSTAQTRLDERQDALAARLPEIERSLKDPAGLEAASRCCRELLYLEKWRSQIRERFHQLL